MGTVVVVFGGRLHGANCRGQNLFLEIELWNVQIQFYIIHSVFENGGLNIFYTGNPLGLLLVIFSIASCVLPGYAVD